MSSAASRLIAVGHRTARWALAHGRLTAALGLLAAVAVLAASGFWRGPRGDRTLTAEVRRGTLHVRLLETGVLRPAQSLTYRSPLGGREAEVTFLAPEGARVQEGDLLVRLDTTELERELERATQAQRQAEMELQVGEVERSNAASVLQGLVDGEGSLEIEEVRTNLRLAEKRVERLRQEHEGLKPLLAKGYITQEESDRAAFALEQAEAELLLARKKAEVFIEQRQPRERERAKLQLAQRDAQLSHSRPRLEEARALVKSLRQALEACSIYARGAGLVVYEEYLAASPRRKIRIGDRVTASQGLVTLPEVSRMLVESSVRETDVHWVKAGQRTTVGLDAFPGLRLSGRVVAVGTLAKVSVERPFEDKRFDLIVELDKSDAELKPEMTARLEIVVDERPNVLLVPVNAVFDRDGQAVAHVVSRWGIQTRQLKLGASNELYAEVLDGVREGERVALTDIEESADVPAPPEAAVASPRKPGGR